MLLALLGGAVPAAVAEVVEYAPTPFSIGLSHRYSFGGESVETFVVPDDAVLGQIPQQQPTGVSVAVPLPFEGVAWSEASAFRRAKELAESEDVGRPASDALVILWEKQDVTVLRTDCGSTRFQEAENDPGGCENLNHVSALVMVKSDSTPHVHFGLVPSLWCNGRRGAGISASASADVPVYTVPMYFTRGDEAIEIPVEGSVVAMSAVGRMEALSIAKRWIVDTLSLIHI